MSRNADVRRYLTRALAGIAILATGTLIRGDETREVFTASAMRLAGPQPEVVDRVTLYIDRWTTADDDHRLATAMKNGGSKDVVQTLQDLKSVGRISSPGAIGYPLQYASQTTLPDGTRQIVLMTDRPMSFAEVWNQPKTVDYPITYIELKVNKDGNGSGKMMVATKLISSRKMIVVEDWATQPIQLNDVKKQS